ncbi:MAG TPA: hypothetical protein VLM18_03550 [Croceibacterium sp.]|nr:hypothetical protein [Croceibacterium sp.]
MRSLVVIAAVAFGLAGSSLADEPKPKAEIVERDTSGHATKVRIASKVYDVCTKDKTDDCINPREGGLDFGTQPLDHWPGKPASEGK